MQTRSTAALPTSDDLIRYVRTALCERDGLDFETTPFVRTPINRRGELWGYSFHAEGPRQLRTSAVWSANEERILIYNSAGTRVQDVRLSESPTIDGDLYFAMT